MGEIDDKLMAFSKLGFGARATDLVEAATKDEGTTTWQVHSSMTPAFHTFFGGIQPSSPHLNG